MKECEVERDTLVIVPRIGANQFMGNGKDGKEAFLGQTVFEGHYQ